MPENFREEALDLHSKNKGKLEIRSKVKLETKKDLSLAYTPGVAEISKEIAKNPELAYKYTIKSNTVVIVTDGSAVLGLGNIGGYGAIPVMEGKAILMKEFAGIDAFPICFKDYHVDFIEDIKNITPIFGAVLLEDIAAPKCFEVEEQLQGIGIPVMHDDQWGTAIVVLAALINAAKVLKKDMSDFKVVINGAGAAGIAITKLLGKIKSEHVSNVKDIIVCDTKGTIYRGRDNLNKYKEEIAEFTNKRNIKGDLSSALEGADVFIGVSAGNIVTENMIRKMNKDPVVFAMANPIPEIMPELAKNAGAKIIGTGRSDFPNQINNVLAFPGLFRAALDSRATNINIDMKIAASIAIANHVKNPTVDFIIPDVLDKTVVNTICKMVCEAAVKTGCARII